jgi:hypothetical protein
MDISWYKKKFRDYELCYLNVQEEVASEEEIEKITRMTTSLYDRFYRNVINEVLPYYRRNQVVEKYTYFDPNILKVADNTYIKGFWQSESYFKSIETTIRKEFTFKAPLIGLNADLAKMMDETNSVSVHIRRGDYISNPEFNKKHGTCHISYYEEASRYIAERVQNPTYYIFSDDITWVKQHIFCFNPCVYITHNTGPHSYKDMQLISMCKHNIIANSSFSWWGAWLNSNPDKIVTAPAKWFNDQTAANKDLVPNSWIQL